ncbi:CobW family GTP-binding protein [Halonotius roseus]|nr:GTP-binding protein [Halonotius roseus]
MQEVIPVTLLSGTLGAGKTTFLKQIITCEHNYRMGVVINDVGEINVDANLIERHVESDEMIELSNGCICCSMRGDLEDSLIELATTEELDHLLIEPSGISHPKPVAKELIQGRSSAYYDLDSIITIVDARNFYDNLVDKKIGTDGNSNNKKPLPNQMIDGIEFCDTILINKKDLVNQIELTNVTETIENIQSKAEIKVTEFGDVEPKEVINTGRFDPEDVANSPVWKQVLHEKETGAEDTRNSDQGNHQHLSDEYSIDSFVFQCHQPMDPKRLATTLKSLPDEILRIKGRVHVAGIKDYALNLSVSGNHAYLDVSGRWIASLPQARQNNYQETREIEWHETWGDRETKIVIIGQDMDINSFKQTLENCVCSSTDYEQVSADPFPQTEGEFINF